MKLAFERGRCRSTTASAWLPRVLGLSLFSVLAMALPPATAQNAIDTLNDKFAPMILLEGAKPALPQGVRLRPIYAKGIQLTKASEGWIPHRYNDAAGYCTIGYGHLIKRSTCDGTEPPQFLGNLSPEQGEALLVEDMRGAQVIVMLAVKVELTEGQFAALADFTFNVGAQNFTSSTLLKAVNANQLDRVPSQFRRWVTAGGKEWPGLKTRREREIELFFDGQAIPKAAPRPDENLSVLDLQIGEKP